MAWWRRDTDSRSTRRDDWRRCDGCQEVLPEAELHARLGVCPRCGHHHDLPPERWIDLLSDDGTYRPLGASIDAKSCEVDLSFKDQRRYKERLRSAQKTTGRDEALVSGEAHLEGRPLVLLIWLEDFMAASVGAVALERLALAVKTAREGSAALVSVGAPATLRLQEKAVAMGALARLASLRRELEVSKVPTVSISSAAGGPLFDVLAADITLASPGAEGLLEGGVCGAVVGRSELRSRLAQLLRIFAPRGPRR